MKKLFASLVASHNPEAPPTSNFLVNATIERKILKTASKIQSEQSSSFPFSPSIKNRKENLVARSLHNEQRFSPQANGIVEISREDCDGDCVGTLRDITTDIARIFVIVEIFLDHPRPEAAITVIEHLFVLLMKSRRLIGFETLCGRLQSCGLQGENEQSLRDDLIEKQATKR
jgi:hypothetical protein